MQLSSMCFGALLALCVVACCAYHICGPAEELDYTNRYSAFKSEHPRLPPELLREIYTLPSCTSLNQPEGRPGSAVKSPATLPQPSPSPSALTSRPAEVGHGGPMSGFMEGGMRAASVSRESLGGQRTALAGHLPNGRLRGPTAGEMTPPQIRRPLTVQNTRADVCRPPRLLNLNCMVDGRPRLLTLSAMTSSRAAREVAGHGAANRLAAHNQTGSTLDLARAAAAAIPSLSHTHRSFSEPHTSLV